MYIKIDIHIYIFIHTCGVGSDEGNQVQTNAKLRETKRGWRLGWIELICDSLVWKREALLGCKGQVRSRHVQHWHLVSDHKMIAIACFQEFSEHVDIVLPCNVTRCFYFFNIPLKPKWKRLSKGENGAARKCANVRKDISSQVGQTEHTAVSRCQLGLSFSSDKSKQYVKTMMKFQVCWY